MTLIHQEIGGFVDVTGTDASATSGHSLLFPNDNTTLWSNAGSTTNATNGTTDSNYIHGNCNGRPTDDGSNESCEDENVATPSSGGVFADVHWVHVFNAHIFPLQDVGYYQYDQTMGLGNIIQDNDSITSRDGYGYNIYGKKGERHVMRDVWGVANVNDYIDTANNAPPDNEIKVILNDPVPNGFLNALWAIMASKTPFIKVKDVNWISILMIKLRSQLDTHSIPNMEHSILVTSPVTTVGHPLIPTLLP